MLSATDLHFTYAESDRPVIRGISFDLKAGEIVSLLGPSGCGKSTILRLVAGLLSPESGMITWPAGEKRLSFVFQDAALMPWATVTENVLLPLSLKNTVGESDVEKAHDMLAAVGLEGFDKRYPHKLSGGQRMRVSIARALIAHPELLLLDEPFAALDEILRFQMNEMLLKLRRKQGWSALFVTHSVYEAAYLSDRVFIIKNGTIEGEVKPSLNRDLPSFEQRGSPEFSKAVSRISKLLEARR
ncbi:ABC transporter ATP-binding protein [Kordiimonas gwangyangensis]|uniref:ABC transporter ATP-binding protein n=1 Tax=Kordiimonas gwangyangensis TaxID=288022 RepID=UPI00036F9686|nr:ABC transporter ATP-binding protein [Kordiimonas gwangyangensis]